MPPMIPSNDPTQMPGGPGQLPPGGPSRPGVDPSNAFQSELLGRLMALPMPDRLALKNGISPEARAVLAKVLPELGHLMGAKPPGAAPGGAPAPGATTTGAPAATEMAGMEDEAEQPEAPPPPDDSTPLKPAGAKSKLARFGA